MFNFLHYSHFPVSFPRMMSIYWEEVWYDKAASSGEGKQKRFLASCLTLGLHWLSCSDRGHLLAFIGTVLTPSGWSD